MDTTELINQSCRICLNDITSGVLIFSEEGKRQYLEAKVRKYLYITVGVLKLYKQFTILIDLKIFRSGVCRRQTSKSDV